MSSSPKRQRRSKLPIFSVITRRLNYGNIDMSRMMKSAKTKVAPIGSGPITLVPNEILMSILKNIEVQQLILLRGVSHRWQAIIEAICGQKKSLKIFTLLKDIEDTDEMKKYHSNFNNNYSQFIESEKFKQMLRNNQSTDLHINNGAILSSKKFATFLSQLFPSLEDLSISKSIITEANLNLLTFWPNMNSLILVAEKLKDGFSERFCQLINSLASLRSLHFSVDGACKNMDFKPLAPTLARLECFQTLSFGKMEEIFTLLGPKISQLCLGNVSCRWPEPGNLQIVHSLKPTLAANLTHLCLTECGHYKDRINFVHLYSNFINLQYICLAFYNHLYDFSQLLIPEISNLKQLKEFRLMNVGIDISPITRNLPKPVNSMKILTIQVPIVLNGPLTENWCQILNQIFPFLERLQVHDPFGQLNSRRGQLLLPVIDAHKSCFKKLKTFQFNTSTDGIIQQY